MEDQKQDTLQKFGKTFQSKCIAGLLTSRPFLEQVHDIIDPKYFESQSDRWIVDKLMWYFGEYQDLPTMEVFKKELDKMESSSDTSMKPVIIESLRAVYKLYNATDLEYVQDEFLTFCINQKWKSTIIKSSDLLIDGRYDDIKRLVEETRHVGMERDLGLNWSEDLEGRFSVLSRNVVKSPWVLVNQIMDGGLGPGELGCIVAPSGIGKTWVLSAIGAAAVRKGLRVAHYSLELVQNYVGLRYDTIVTGIEPSKIRENVDVVRDAISKISGELLIKYFPTKSITYLAIQSHVQRLTMLGKKPDLIIVDYADLLRSQSKNEAKYQELGAIYEELRRMAGELQVPIWTASQSQRSSIQDDIIEADKIAESYSKIFTADFVMSVSRKQSDKQHHTARFYIIKNRFGPDGLTFPAEMDLSRGHIELFDEHSSRGGELATGMSDGKRVLTTLLSKKLVDKSKDVLLDI